MSWIQDAKGEWDKLPGGGKVAVAGIGLLTVGVAGYEWYINRNASATSASQQAGVPPDPNVPQGVGGLSALDTASLANMIAGLVNTQGQVGATGAPGPTGPPGPTPFTWPTALNGMKIWQGTTTHNFFFGPKGPLPGRKDQTLLSSLFPEGTVFSTQNNKLFYQLPGTATPVASNITLVNPTPRPTVVNSSPVLPSPTIHIAG